MDIKKKAAEVGIVPVVVLDDKNDALPLANALLEGGIPFMEITLRTSCAIDSIKIISESCPDMIVGAGTVINVEQAALAIENGAKFIVSPGLDEGVVKFCQEKGVFCIPGCVTPTEIMKAISLGLDLVKFFPANVYGGLKALKALSAPFSGISFLPTGGVDIDNLSEYVSAPFISAIGGSFVCKKSDISAHEFEKITELSKQTIKKITEARNS